MAVLLFAVGVFTWLSLHTESVGIVGLWVGRICPLALGPGGGSACASVSVGWLALYPGQGKDPAFGRFLTGLGL